MATAGLTIVRGRPSTARKAARSAGRTVLNVALGVVALVWLVPTVGLLVTALRPLGDATSSGWWTVFTDAAGLTLDNFANLLTNATITRSLWNTVLIAVPATVLVDRKSVV
jgi:alpha-glucoside transport system permease protein